MLVRSCLLLALILAPAAARAGTVVVDPDGPLPAIQAGVDAAAAGDRVKVRAGVYAESVFVPAEKAGLRIEADGDVLLDVRRPGGGGAGPGLRIDADGVRVTGIDVRHCADDPITQAEGHGLLVLGDDVRLEDCSVTNCARAGVRALANGLRVDGCRFEDTGRKFLISAVTVDGDDLRIQETDFTLVPRGAVRVTGAGARLKDVRIDHVRDGRGIEITGDGAVLAGSLLRTIGGAGLVVEGNDLRVVDTTFQAVKGDAVRVTGDGARIEDSRFEGVLLRAIDVAGDGAIVEENEVELAVIGVEIEGDGARVRDNEARRLRQSFIGVDGAGAVITRNTLRDSPAAAAGIGLFGSGDVIGNTCLDLRGVGVSIGSLGGAAVRDNVVRRARIGFVAEALGVEFEGNVAVDCAEDGFQLLGDGLVVVGNRAARCGDDGFDLGEGSGIACLDNVAKRCGGEGFDHSATGTVLRGNIAKKNRIDLANDGTFAELAKNDFGTGGAAVAPEID